LTSGLSAQGIKMPSTVGLGEPYAITVREFDALAPHLAAWDQLAWNAPQETPTLLPAWVDAFMRHRLQPDERWFCSFAYLGDQLIGVLPIVAAPHPILGRSRPLLSLPFDKFTPSGDILLAPDHAAMALRCLLDEARREAPGHTGVRLYAAHHNSPVWGAIQNGLKGYAVRRMARSPYSFLDVSGNFATYMSSLGKLRSDLKRFRRKLESRGSVSVEIHRGADVKDSFLQDFLALEAAGWKGRNGTSILDDPSVVAFYTTLVRNFAAQGRWEWQAIRVDGRLVAAGMGVRCGDILMLPKFAFDEEFAECRPGSLLTKEIIENAFSRPEVVKINPMSRLSWACHWRMGNSEYTDLHLVRRDALPILFELPPIVVKSIYQDRVRPRIPSFIRKAYDRFKRRGGRKPGRAAESRYAQTGSTIQ
jgi:Acetyltransferase (GNAT) domain